MSLREQVKKLAQQRPELRRHLVSLLRKQGATPNKFHIAWAVAWTELDHYPMHHRNGLEALWRALYGTEPPKDLGFMDPDEAWGGDTKVITKAARELHIIHRPAPLWSVASTCRAF